MKVKTSTEKQTLRRARTCLKWPESQKGGACNTPPPGAGDRGGMVKKGLGGQALGKGLEGGQDLDITVDRGGCSMPGCKGAEKSGHHYKSKLSSFTKYREGKNR